MRGIRKSCLSVGTDKLLKIIALQTEIAKLGIDMARVTATVVDRLPSITNADGAIIEYAEDHEMVTRGVNGFTRSLLGLRVERHGSLSGREDVPAVVES